VLLCVQRLPGLRLFPKRTLVRAKRERVLAAIRQLHNGQRNLFVQRGVINVHRGQASTLDPGGTIVFPY
jgi:hypothetical protein